MTEWSQQTYGEDALPALPDLQQRPELDEGDRVVSVRQVEPVLSQDLPSKSGVSRSWQISTTAQSIGGQDYRRRRLLIIPVDGAIYVGTREDIGAQAAAVIPQGAVLELRHADPVFAAAVAGTVLLSVITETWGD